MKTEFDSRRPDKKKIHQPLLEFGLDILEIVRTAPSRNELRATISISNKEMISEKAAISKIVICKKKKSAQVSFLPRAQLWKGA